LGQKASLEIYGGEIHSCRQVIERERKRERERERDPEVPQRMLPK